jgi:hypothetical protein
MTLVKKMSNYSNLFSGLKPCLLLMSQMSGMIVLFTNFSLFSPFYSSLNPDSLVMTIMILFIPIFHSPTICLCVQYSAHWMSFPLFLYSQACDQSPDSHVPATWLHSHRLQLLPANHHFCWFLCLVLSWKPNMVCVNTLPFWPCSWPSSFPFSHQVHVLLKVTLHQKTQKHHKNKIVPWY